MKKEVWVKQSQHTQYLSLVVVINLSLYVAGYAGKIVSFLVATFWIIILALLFVKRTQHLRLGRWELASELIFLFSILTGFYCYLFIQNDKMWRLALLPGLLGQLFATAVKFKSGDKMQKWEEAAMMFIWTSITALLIISFLYDWEIVQPIAAGSTAFGVIFVLFALYKIEKSKDRKKVEGPFEDTALKSKDTLYLA